MRLNGYLDSDLQKAFLPTVPGVAEHQAKLAAVINSARRNKKALAVCWLDITNAYGSVHHSLIQFSLAHYHSPPEFCRLLQSWYTGLSATISTEEWSTNPVPLNIGVYQGDPLSVVIFLTIINTLSDTLLSRGDLGFTLPNSSITINHLLYADDACIISNSPAGCQHLLDMVQHWLEWAQMRVKVPKCRSLVLKASTGRQVYPNLSICGDKIPPAEADSFNNTARSSLVDTLHHFLSAIDHSPVTQQQKLRLFKYGVCPRLQWPLLVEDFPLSWLERQLQPLATKALKKWSGLAKSSNTSILFLPAKKGGLALPSLVGLFKRLQATKMVQLLTSQDAGVQKAADLHLVEEKEKKRLKFRPAALVDSIRSQHPPLSCQGLTRAAKTLLSQEEDDERYQSLCQLSTQGEMAQCWEDTSPESSMTAAQSLPSEAFKFVLNASLGSLPTNVNLHLWGKKASDTCSLCHGSRQTLLHVLNNCLVAMELRRYSIRHNAVLEVIASFVKAHLPSHYSIFIDSSSDTYTFPHHIVPTNLWPDIVWWSDEKKELWLFELTISFETLVEDARRRKTAKYHDLVEAGLAAGYRSKLITVEVGSRGMVDVSDFTALRYALDASKKEFSAMTTQVICTAILESFKIWASRNCTT